MNPKIAEFLRGFGGWLLTGITILVVAAIVIALFYADFEAYRQRFPGTSAWTYLFKN